MRIYIGNLNYLMTEIQLRELFSEFGAVTSTKIMNNKSVDNNNNFAFVEMKERTDGETAVAKLHNITFMEQCLTVNEAKKKGNVWKFPGK